MLVQNDYYGWRVSVPGHTLMIPQVGQGQEAARTQPAEPIRYYPWGFPAMPAVSRLFVFRCLSVLGWGYALAAWAVMGHPAGVDPGFILGASCGITFTLCATVTRVLPESQAVYALGFREGQCAHEDSEEPPPLALVR